MANKLFDRAQLHFEPISERSDEIQFDKVRVAFDEKPKEFDEETLSVIRQTAMDIIEAKHKGASRMLTFGTSLIQNGLGPLAGEFLRRGWLTHLATTGTSVVDDWEFASRGAAGEDSGKDLRSGMFGMWQETAWYINLAILVGNWEGLGLGESLCKVIKECAIVVPDAKAVEASMSSDDPETIAAAAELLEKIREFDIKPGEIKLDFPHKDISLMNIAAENGVPFTVHPQLGLDVPFMHPICSFSAIGQTAERDFLYFVSNVNNLENGVYISAGSSVASPMIFEKALSMSQNVRFQKGNPMVNHKIVVVDLSPSRWNWMRDGEPPETRPEYYLRYCKSFSRSKAKSMYYVSADVRDFLLRLYDYLLEMDK